MEKNQRPWTLTAPAPVIRIKSNLARFRKQWAELVDVGLDALK